MEVTMEELLWLCWGLSVGAMIFSWITMLTENWWFYIPTVLLALGNFYFVAQALFG